MTKALKIVVYGTAALNVCFFLSSSNEMNSKSMSPANIMMTSLNDTGA